MVSEFEREAFICGYIECALWTATSDSDNPEPLDMLGWESDDFSQEAREAIEADCDDFLESFGDVIRQLDYAFGNGMDVQHVFDAAGHDFCLTRNRHGAGFWDRGLGDMGKYLTDMSHPYGEFYVFVHGETLEVEG